MPAASPLAARRPRCAPHIAGALSVTTSDRAAFFALSGVDASTAEVDGDVVRVMVPDASAARAILAAHGDAVRDFEFRHGRMDDVFLAVTGASRTCRRAGRAADGRMSIVLGIVSRTFVSSSETVSTSSSRC
jgi:hypothetical protein